MKRGVEYVGNKSSSPRKLLKYEFLRPEFAFTTETIRSETLYYDAHIEHIIKNQLQKKKTYNKKFIKSIIK